jgi:hypothetical protein
MIISLYTATLYIVQSISQLDKQPYIHSYPLTFVDIAEEVELLKNVKAKPFLCFVVYFKPLSFAKIM